MMSLRCNILFLLVFLLTPLAMMAEDPIEDIHVDDEEFDVTEMVFDHIMDSHSWHIADYTDDSGHKHAISIALPVILWHEGQLDVFMSSAFDHGHATVTKGDNNYFLYQGDIYLTDEEGSIHHEINEETGKSEISNAAPLDLSITKNVAAMIISAIILLLVFLSVARAYKKRPGKPAGLQGFMEPLFLFVRDDIAKPNIGEKYEKYLPYIMTVFFFILFNNLLGLIPFFPGGANVTGNISVTMTLAAFTMVITNVSGTKQYWKHIFATPGLPFWLYPIMIPVELIGIITKPFALMVRLFANITAGHIIILSLVSLIFIFKTAMMGFVSVPFVLFMDILELLVAAIQAYIFTLLSALFIGLALEGDH
ncbi:MAG: F0F1 ATP synthase subunit A [Bacteroidales bacterium]